VEQPEGADHRAVRAGPEPQERAALAGRGAGSAQERLNRDGGLLRRRPWPAGRSRLEDGVTHPAGLAKDLRESTASAGAGERAPAPVNAPAMDLAWGQQRVACDHFPGARLCAPKTATTTATTIQSATLSAVKNSAIATGARVAGSRAPRVHRRKRA